MCRSMVDIQSLAAEIRRGKKEIYKDRRWKETTGQKYNGPLLHRAAIIRPTDRISVGGNAVTSVRLSVRLTVWIRLCS